MHYPETPSTYWSYRWQDLQQQMLFDAWGIHAWGCQITFNRRLGLTLSNFNQPLAPHLYVDIICHISGTKKTILKPAMLKQPKELV